MELMKRLEEADKVHVWDKQWRRKQGGQGGPTFWPIEATPTNLLHAIEHAHSYSCTIH